MGDWDHFCNWYTKEAVINNSMMDTFVFDSLLHQAGISTDAKEGIIGLQGSHILRGECCPPKDCTNVYSHQLSKQLNWRGNEKPFQILLVSIDLSQDL